jgi:beta-galactosidase
MKTVDEIKLLKLGAASAGGAKKARTQPAEPAASVGLLMDFSQLWYYRTLPQARRWNQPRWLTLWYAAMARLGLRVQILHPDRPWPGDLKLIVAPGVQMVDEALVSRWDQFAAGGGHLLLTCRTALMDQTGQLWEGKLAAPVLRLIGGEIETYDGLPEDTFGQVELETVKYRWGVWGDLLYAEPDTRVLSRYADQFYAGAAAVIQRKHGSGVVTYCGVHGEGEFVDALMEDVAQQAGLAVESLPPRVHILQRGPYRICLNYQDATISVPAPRGAKFIVGARRLEPAGVAVWEA